MIPIQNMASPLSEEDHHRIFGPGHETLKGATAANSMLLDYLTPNVIGCIAQAIELGHPKIILGAVLATLSNFVYIVVARIFDFSEAENGNYNVHIHAKSFYASFGIMRTCRPVYGLVDFASLVNRSDILLCPEFWLQDSAYTEEHMNAQVTLANRLYQYGIYHGRDGRRHIGIGVEYAPPARESGDLVRYIYSDASLVSAENFITNEPQRRSSLRRVLSVCWLLGATSYMFQSTQIWIRWPADYLQPDSQASTPLSSGSLGHANEALLLSTKSFVLVAFRIFLASRSFTNPIVSRLAQRRFSPLTASFYLAPDGAQGLGQVMAQPSQTTWFVSSQSAWRIF
ncbi:hypothetical protein LZL87_006379 [Fusarium oxysporum]|nr:hypothetical protein LZL87_006379 [Fusarium oxysporum]